MADFALTETQDRYPGVIAADQLRITIDIDFAPLQRSVPTRKRM